MQVKDNTKCSSVEVSWEKRSAVVSLWVEIPTLIIKVVVGLYYRNTPSFPPQEILSEIKEAENLGQVLIEGDFNCPYIEWVSASSG